MGLKLRLSDFNLMVGMGWNKPDDVFIRFSFACTEADGPTVQVSVKNWSAPFPLDEPFEPPASQVEYAFWLGDCRKLIRLIEPYYYNAHAVITFKTAWAGWEVVGGPGHGFRLEGM